MKTKQTKNRCWKKFTATKTHFSDWNIYMQNKRHRPRCHQPIIANMLLRWAQDIPSRYHRARWSFKNHVLFHTHFDCKQSIKENPITHIHSLTYTHKTHTHFDTKILEYLRTKINNDDVRGNCEHHSAFVKNTWHTRHKQPINHNILFFRLFFSRLRHLHS